MAAQRFVSAAQRASQAMRALPDLARQEAPLPYASLLEADQQQLLREMHTYRRANPIVARTLWVVGGLFGAHRYYLEQFGLGALMTLTAGGVLGWWIRDGFHLKTMVAAYNDEQTARESENRPPIGMDFVPRVGPEALAALPAWHLEREQLRNSAAGWKRRFMSIGLDLLALVFFGYLLGEVTEKVGMRTPALAAAAMVFTINFADLLIPYRHLPIARGLLHWDYKLRLFYHFNAPGRRLVLYFRPLLALFYAPFREKDRAEARLYLEIGGVFVLASALIGLYKGDFMAMVLAMDIGEFLKNWVQSLVVGFILVCGFTAPIGAILMKHTLLRRPNAIRWLLSAAVLFFLVKGLLEG